MARPVVSEVVENRRFQGKLDRPLPASRYLDTTNVTFEILFECADKSVDRVERKISVLEDEFGELFVNSSEKPSSRPLGEIVMEAVLYTTTPATPSYPLVKKSLADFPMFRSCEPLNSPRNFVTSRLTDAPNLLTYNLADRTIRSGNVACLAAGGSTMIKWGTVLDTLKNGQEAGTLSDWFRVQRQARIGETAQGAIDRLVTRFVNEYNIELKRKFGHTEAELMGLSKKDPVTIEKKDRLPGIRKEIFQELHEGFPGSLPPILVDYRPKVIGQAYEGQTLHLKSKCAVCQNVYPYLVPTEVGGQNPQPPQDYEFPAELHPKRLKVPRGCCAECLVFVPTIGALKMAKKLMEQLE
ncbi:hypothetical protein XANCAGTX0491_004588 [Xanthoria calcicola]